MSEVIFKKGVRRSEKFAPLIEKFIHTPHPISEMSLIHTIKDLMFFAALLGFKNKTKKPLSDYEERLVSVAPAEWMNDKNLPVIFAIALADSKDSNILKEEREDEMLSIFEEYINGGFSILEGWILPTDNTGEVSILKGLEEEKAFESEVLEEENDLENVTF